MKDITITKIPNNKRMGFLPSITNAYIEYENLIYNLADRVVEEYSGGYWDFIEIKWDNDGETQTFKVMLLDNKEDSIVKIISMGWQRTFKTSPLIASIAINLMVLSNFSFFNNKGVAEKASNDYHALLDFAKNSGIDDKSIISQIID